MKLCVIPARGGSKRIPHKNIREFAGLPLIAHSIKNALNSGVFDEVIVSTDDENIAAVALEFGASVPFMREAALSDDFATTGDVMRDACVKMGEKFDVVCCLYATAPLLNAEILRAAAVKFDELNKVAFGKNLAQISDMSGAKNLNDFSKTATDLGDIKPQAKSSVSANEFLGDERYEAIADDLKNLNEPDAAQTLNLKRAKPQTNANLSQVSGLNCEQNSAAICEFLFSACEFAYPIQRALKLGEDGCVSMFYPEFALTRSQDLEAAYHDAGQFYFGRRGAWTAKLPIFAPHSRAFVLPRNLVCDIDTMADFKFAQKLYEINQRG